MKIGSRMLKFGVVGVANTLVDFCLFVMLVRLFGVNPLLANLLSFCAAVLNSYLLNFLWTFKKMTGAVLGLRSFLLFFLVNGVGFLISSLVIWKLQTVMFVEGAKLVAIVLALCWNFTATRYLVIGSDKHAT